MTEIFVYGTLKQQHRRSGALAGQTFLGTAKTEPSYRLFDLGYFPGLVERDDGVAVEGEVWLVDDECLEHLDAIECVPHLYRRVFVHLIGWYGVQTYLFQKSVAGCPDCGTSWNN